MNIEQHGAGGVADIGGVDPPLGQLVDQPRVHCSECQFAGFSELAGAGDILEHPGDLAGGEIGIDQKARALLNGLAMSRVAQALAEIGGAAILPDNRIVNGLSGVAVPQERGLALIGNADARYVFGAGTCFLKSFTSDSDLRRNNVLGIVLNPSGLGKDLLELALGNGADGTSLIEQQGARAGGALIQCQDVFHASPFAISAEMLRATSLRR